MINLAEAISQFTDCIDKQRAAGKVINLDIDPAAQYILSTDKREYDWQSAGPWWVFLYDEKFCNMNIYEHPVDAVSGIKNNTFGLKLGPQGYTMAINSVVQKNVSASTMSISLDGKSLGSFAGAQYKTDNGKYGETITVPVDKVTSLFKMLQDGAKILTVNAGEPVQFQLSDSDQALRNLQACWDKKASLETEQRNNNGSRRPG